MGITTTGCGTTLTSGKGYDPAAAAYFTATGITSGTIKNAINTLVLALKAASLWTPMYAIYPLPGSTNAINAVNLKTPGTYDITWTGGVTPSSNGVTGNGTNGYGNTGLAPSVIGQNSFHMSMYKRTAGGGSEYTMGSDNGSTQNTVLSVRSSGALLGYVNDNTGAGPTTVATTGFFSVSRNSSANFAVFANSTKVKTATATSTGATTRPIAILADNNNGSIIGYSSANLAFVTIGSGLSDQNESNLYTAIQVYQTALSRNV